MQRQGGEVLHLTVGRAVPAGSEVEQVFPSCENRGQRAGPWAVDVGTQRVTFPLETYTT